MSEHPEHDKLEKVNAISQTQGELLEWLASQGVQLMVWHSGTETIDECAYCDHFSEATRARCTKEQRCSKCKGTHQHERRVEGFIPWGKSIERILAEYHGIDLAVIECEKRAMLDRIRQQA